MSNNLSKFLGASFLILIFILSIFALLYGWEIKINESTCKNITNQKEQNRCFRDLALIKNEDNFCQEINDSDSIKDKCYFDLAIGNNDLSLCHKADDKEDWCFKKILKKYPDEERCEEVESGFIEAKCFYHLAIINDDLNLCGKARHLENKCRRKLSSSEKTGFDECNFGPGWSEPKNQARNCNSGGYLKDCCCCFIHSHIHDLGRIFQDKRVLIKYRPGLHKGCESTMLIYSSIDGEEWELILDVSVTQETWSPKTTYDREIFIWRRFRYIKVFIPECYVDYSSAKVL